MTRPTIRLRLTALYGGIFAALVGALLLVSYWIMARNLDRTLGPVQADDPQAELATQFLLAFAGGTLLAVAAGWLVAGRALSPIARITETARRVSQDRLDDRIALDGPEDELRELADTIDAMLDRLGGAFDAQQRFVANASHELRSPLTVIRTEADVALADPDASVAELRSMGEGVLEAADRMEALLDGLLVLARSQRGLLRSDRVDLAAAAGAAVTAVPRDRVQVRRHFESAPVRGDRGLLERLAGNLVENGVRHNVPGGFVSVTTRTEDGRAVLRVSSSGPRLDPATVDRLLEPFERGRRSSHAPGAGLGLSIVRSVAEAHGGTVRLSARPEGGLDVEVSLPVAR